MCGLERLFFLIVVFRAILLRVLEGGRSHAGEALEVFAEERRVGETHLVRNLRHGLVGVAQFHLYARHYGAAYPLLCGDAACLPYHGAKITLRKAQALGIVVYVVVLGAVLVGKMNEAVEDSPLARARGGKDILVSVKQLVIVMHQDFYLNERHEVLQVVPVRQSRI